MSRTFKLAGGVWVEKKRLPNGDLVCEPKGGGPARTFPRAVLPKDMQSEPTPAPVTAAKE